jgi:hypothetical protein
MADTDPPTEDPATEDADKRVVDLSNDEVLDDQEVEQSLEQMDLTKRPELDKLPEELRGPVAESMRQAGIEQAADEAGVDPDAVEEGLNRLGAAEAEHQETDGGVDIRERPVEERAEEARQSADEKDQSQRTRDMSQSDSDPSPGDSGGRTETDQSPTHGGTSDYTDTVTTRRDAPADQRTTADAAADHGVEDGEFDWTNQTVDPEPDVQPMTVEMWGVRFRFVYPENENDRYDFNLEQLRLRQQLQEIANDDERDLDLEDFRPQIEELYQLAFDTVVVDGKPPLTDDLRSVSLSRKVDFTAEVADYLARGEESVQRFFDE